jgi:hypothetical protein
MLPVPFVPAANPEGVRKLHDLLGADKAAARVRTPTAEPAVVEGQ